ncbi:hypothetical protein V8G54_030463 [Vigna mungo]|uniref:Transposase (putative) gypsy type domain-containing protein n=1 Tax=Vigna mungo TaxID=3915 RepID=A0AAQ3MVM8_VIGMU
MTVTMSSSGSAGGDGGDSTSESRSSRSSELSSRVELSDAGKDSDRIAHGATLFLLEGGVEIEVVRPTPAGGWPAIASYNWASHDVGSYEFEFGNRGVLQEWANQSFVARDEADAQLFRLSVCYPNERVFHGKGTSSEDFFYVYTYLFRRMMVHIPFTRFQAVVLKRMNVAPSQLHPNGWACIQVFMVMCSALGVGLSTSVFFHYFHVRPLAKRGWVSLTSIQKGLFKAYAESFKDFKHKFFKVIIKESGRSEFVDSSGEPLFPFYWSEEPARMSHVPACDLTPSELEAVRAINDLPRCLPARKMVECLCHEDFINVAFGTILQFGTSTCWLGFS